MDIFEHSGRSSPPRVQPGGGFSLVEVTLAIGIMAFTFVSIFGLIPTGLSVLNKAMDTTTDAAIIQRVMNDAQQADFATLTAASSSNTIRYFDNQGDDVTAASATPAASAIYEVHTVITPATTLPTATSLTNLATVTIQIITNPGHRTPTSNAATGLWKDASFTISNYSGYVSQSR